MWTVDEHPEHFAAGHGTGGYDGDWFRWQLADGRQQTFTVVKAPRHVLMRAGDLTARTVRAAQTCGRSEIERYMADDVPPRVIELRTGGREPLVTPRDTAAA